MELEKNNSYALWKLCALEAAEGSCIQALLFFFSSRRRHTRLQGDWSPDVCSSDVLVQKAYSYGASADGEGLVPRAKDRETNTGNSGSVRLFDPSVVLPRAVQAQLGESVRTSKLPRCRQDTAVQTAGRTGS